MIVDIIAAVFLGVVLFILAGIPVLCFAVWVAMHCIRWTIDEWQRLFG